MSVFLCSVLGPGQETVNKRKRPHNFLFTQDNVDGIYITFEIIFCTFVRSPSSQFAGGLKRLCFGDMIVPCPQTEG